MMSFARRYRWTITLLAACAAVLAAEAAFGYGSWGGIAVAGAGGAAGGFTATWILRRGQ